MKAMVLKTIGAPLEWTELADRRPGAGEIRVKVGMLGAEEMNAAPEFEDCKAAALKHGVALKQVQAAAIAAYRGCGR